MVPTSTLTPQATAQGATTAGAPVNVQALTDKVIATDMLIGAKCAIKDLALAISEAATPQVRTLLKKQFDASVSLHEQLTNFMSSKGWYNAYNIKQQIQQDIQSAQAVMAMAK